MGFDSESMTSSTKVITITSDLLSQHQMGTSDQSGSLTNLTVKFHLDESGNVQVMDLLFLIVLNYLGNITRRLLD